MKTIYKYTLESGMFKAPKVIGMPKGAKFLKADIQNGAIVAWFEVEVQGSPIDDANDIDQRWFQLFGTGWEIPQHMGSSYEYLDTFQHDPYVWHLYEYKGV